MSGDLGWRKASRCDSNACVEVWVGSHVVAVRDSEDPERVIAVTAEAWRKFLAEVRAT